MRVLCIQRLQYISFLVTVTHVCTLALPAPVKDVHAYHNLDGVSTNAPRPLKHATACQSELLRVSSSDLAAVTRDSPFLHTLSLFHSVLSHPCHHDDFEQRIESASNPNSAAASRAYRIDLPCLDLSRRTTHLCRGYNRTVFVCNILDRYGLLPAYGEPTTKDPSTPLILEADKCCPVSATRPCDLNALSAII